MKKKWTIVAFSMCLVIVVGLIATIIVLASGTQGVGTSVSVLYVATDIEGTVSAKYSKVNKNTSTVISTTDMVTSSGSKTVSFLSTAPTTTNLLNPTESNIALTAEQDLVITYTFTAVATYYATLEYKDSSTSASNIEFSYALNDGAYEPEMSMPIEVTPDHSTTYSIKLHIANTARNANLSGSLSWALTKEKPDIPLRDSNLSIYFVNNDSSTIKQNNVAIQKSNDGTKFKIIGPTPIIDSTSTTSYLNGSFDERTITATGKVSSIDDLTNRNGAEFYYFCTNSAVVGSLSYNDPETIYYTSTADSTLESWYDLPDSNTNLYACFMTPNYTAEEKYTGSDTQIIISNNIANIPYNAFSSKSTITDVAIPQSVENIGYGDDSLSGVFYRCSSLQKIVLPNSVVNIGDLAFDGCSGLKNVEIGTGLTSIGYLAFNSCYGLTIITIPDSVTNISERAFAGCRGLTSVIVSENNDIYYSLGNCIIKRSTKTLIQGCKTSVIPENVDIIGTYAFSGCSSLTSILIPDSVTSIGDWAFNACSNLTNVTIGSGVTSIGASAFSSCENLTSIMIPNSVTSIGKNAFYCTNLTYNEKDNLKYLGNDTNLYVVVCEVNDKTKTTYTIDSNAKLICAAAFSNCSKLTEIIIPESVMSIGDKAFSGCSGLTSITIGDGVMSIGESAFRRCSSLTNITIPKGVTSIGGYAFYSCSGLTSVTFADTSKMWKVGSKTISVANRVQNATYLTDTYKYYTWTKNS